MKDCKVAIWTKDDTGKEWLQVFDCFDVDIDIDMPIDPALFGRRTWARFPVMNFNIRGRFKESWVTAKDAPNWHEKPEDEPQRELPPAPAALPEPESYGRDRPGS